ncbi:hypothetical protein BDV12DRAFT_123946 [Aspergillus spectabilis]
MRLCIKQGRYAWTMFLLLAVTAGGGTSFSPSFCHRRHFFYSNRLFFILLRTCRWITLYSSVTQSSRINWPFRAAYTARFAGKPDISYVFGVWTNEAPGRSFATHSKVLKYSSTCAQ